MVRVGFCKLPWCVQVSHSLPFCQFICFCSHVSPEFSSVPWSCFILMFYLHLLPCCLTFLLWRRFKLIKLAFCYILPPALVS